MNEREQLKMEPWQERIFIEVVIENCDRERITESLREWFYGHPVGMAGLRIDGKIQHPLSPSETIQR